MSKFKRTLLWLGVFATASIVYLWLFGAQTFFALETRKIARSVPIVQSVPVELKDLAVSDAKGKTLSFKGIEFEVPWGDVDEEKTRVVGDWAVIHFYSGNSIILCVEPPDGFITSMTKSKTPDPKIFRELFGPEVLRSDYALHKAIFETSPAK